MNKIVTMVFDPGIREWKFMLHEEFYIMNFDPGGYGTFHSFNCFYFIIYAFDFLGRNFVCTLAIVAYLVCFGVVVLLEEFGLSIEGNRVDVNKFSFKGVRKFEFLSCATRSLKCVLSYRASLGRKHLRAVHVNSGELPNIVAMLFAGVGVVDDYLHNITCIVDIVYIFHMLGKTCDYDLFDATYLICCHVGSDLLANLFREEGMSDLRTNPFQEEGNDTILTRLASSNQESTHVPGVEQVIVIDWVQINSRILKLELNSCDRRGDDRSYNLGLHGMKREHSSFLAKTFMVEDVTNPSIDPSQESRDCERSKFVLSIYIAVTSGTISTLIQLESFKSQRMKVVDLFLSFPEHLESAQSEFGCESYGHFTKGRRSRIWKLAPARILCLWSSPRRACLCPSSPRRRFQYKFLAPARTVSFVGAFFEADAFCQFGTRISSLI